MPQFKLEWTIDIDADTPREAAEKALEIQRRAGSSAVVFNVIDENGEQGRVDLDEDDDDPIHCSRCGNWCPDSGESYGDLCPSCADATEPSEEADDLGG